MKILKIYLFVVLSALLLAGCNKSNDNAEKTAQKDLQENVNENAKNNGRIDPPSVPSTEIKDSKEPLKEKNTATIKNTEETKIALATMQCTTCKKNITKALKTDAGVKDINVNIDGKFVVINYDKTVTSLDKLEGIITAAGYDANGKKADPKAYEKLDECCKVPEKKK